MKRRYVYVLLFAVPASLVAAIVAVLLGAAVAGGLWLFVFGDNPWPASASTALSVLLVLVGVGVWVGLLTAAYAIGKTHEARAARIFRPLMAAAGATAILAVLVVLQQWSVGNLGPKAADVLCSEYCREKGFAASGMPPRDSGAATCSCFDMNGGEALKAPISEITPRKGK